MAATKRFKVPGLIDRFTRDPRVASVQYSPSTGDFAVTFHRPQPEQPDFAENTDSDEPGEQPGDWRFALERFNESPKGRRQ